jgi:hypothetical protein
MMGVSARLMKVSKLKEQNRKERMRIMKAGARFTRECLQVCKGSTDEK